MAVPQPGRRSAPVARALAEAERVRDLRQPVARGPAHHGRMRVHAGAAAKLPEAGVGDEGHVQGPLAERLEASKESDAPGLRQAPVEEHLRGGEHDAAVAVVLQLRLGEIAHAHRAHGAISLEAACDPFRRQRSRHDAVDRLQIAVLLESDDIGYVADEIFHRERGAEAIERMHHEVGVPQPAIAVIPVPSRSRSLGDRCRHRRNDPARLLEAAQLERDRRPDHGVLPFERHREVARPLDPVLLRPRKIGLAQARDRR